MASSPWPLAQVSQSSAKAGCANVVIRSAAIGRKRQACTGIRPLVAFPAVNKSGGRKGANSFRPLKLRRHGLSLRARALMAVEPDAFRQMPEQLDELGAVRRRQRRLRQRRDI